MAGKNNNLTGLAWTALCMKNKAFLGAIQEYKSKDGKIIPVCFSISNAYIFKDAEGIYPTEEMKFQMKNQESGFPEMYDVYEHIADINDEQVSEEVKANLNLVDEDYQDIILRLESLTPYTEEETVNLGGN